MAAVKVRESSFPRAPGDFRGPRLRWEDPAPGVLLAMFAVMAIAFVVGRLTVPQKVVVRAGLPGPTAMTNGVPTGYPQSRAGAVAAAGNFVERLGGQTARDPAVRPALVKTIASSSAQAKVTDLLNGNDATVTSIFGSPTADFTMISTPVSSRVVAYSDTSAVVDSWVVLTFSRPGLPLASAFWGGIRTTLVWEGDWKVGDASPLGLPIPSTLGAKGDPNDLLAGFSADGLVVNSVAAR